MVARFIHFTFGVFVGAKSNSGYASAGGKLHITDCAGTDHDATHILTLVGARDYQIRCAVPASRSENIKPISGGHYRGAVYIKEVTVVKSLLFFGYWAHAWITNGASVIQTGVGQRFDRLKEFYRSAHAALTPTGGADNHIVPSTFESLVERLDITGQAIVVTQDDIECGGGQGGGY